MPHSNHSVTNYSAQLNFGVDISRVLLPVFALCQYLATYLQKSSNLLHAERIYFPRADQHIPVHMELLRNALTGLQRTLVKDDENFSHYFALFGTPDLCIFIFNTRYSLVEVPPQQRY